MPFSIINNWLAQEKESGSENPSRAILSTVTATGVPHSRVVATREIGPSSILFFTQKGTRKTVELATNPNATMTFWFAMQQRQVILEGEAHSISHEENEMYWNTMPRKRQIHFSAYAPFSSKVIEDHEQLTEYKFSLSKQFKDKNIPMCDFYCGYRLVPQHVYFYTLGDDSFSEVFKYTHEGDSWTKQLLAP